MSRRAAQRKRARTDGPGVVLAGPNPGTVDANFFGSVTDLLLYDANHGQHVTKWGGCLWLESSPRIFAARCDIVQKFLDDTGKWPRPPEWLLFIDSDMTFERDVLERALDIIEESDEDIKILGGLCFAGGRSKTAFPTIYTVDNPESFDPSKPLTLLRHYEYPEDTLIKVNATGGAFTLVHREVYEAMREKFAMRNGYPNPYIWYREYEQAGAPYGEDIFFGMVAGSIGYSTYIHTGLSIGHMKRFNLNEDTWKANKDAMIESDQAEIEARKR